jgi:uncharacterized damage-inducible protein DinB
MMRSVLIPVAALGLLVWTEIASAQTSGAGYADALSPSLARVANVMHGTIRRNLEDAAEEMPADEYGFQPTPQVRTFAQLVGHVINANLFFCSQASGEHLPPGPANYEQVSDKAALMKALRASLALCDRAHAATTDANYMTPVAMTGGVGMGPAQTVRGAILMFNIAHNNEHYGNVVVYLRLKGHIPPSTANAERVKK